MTCRLCSFVIFDTQLTQLKGDERPCQRCIKRGLQDACHDGVRKKAKYLHDAPNEALMPGVGGQNLFNHDAALRNNLAIQNAEAARQEAGQFYQNPQPYRTFPQSGPMPPPMMQDTSINAANYAQQSPVSPPFSMSGQQPLHAPSIGQSQADPATATAMPHGWNGGLFDPNDPSLFNFDLASMNFGNHYGALEFGMLGHMATGAGETPPSDSAAQRGSVGQANGSNQYTLPLGSFGESPTQQFAYNDAIMPDWPRGQNLYGQQFSQPSEPPHAFAIETNTANFTSPDSASSPQQGIAKFDDSPTMTYKAAKMPPTPSTATPDTADPQSAPRPQPQPRQHSHISTPQLKSRSQLPTKHHKRPRDPSSIYTTVTAPYSYTSGFHSLIAYLQRRFAASPSKTLTIAKSLASIRPSFIATTKTLNRDDLIFMEKCFQRTLWEYEGFIEGVGTPTIVARRTGEVAAVGKEFSILTGWKKDVLLGREPNLNVNRGWTTSGSGAGSGTSTPSQRGVLVPPPPEDANADGKRLQPVFLAELLDDESVVEFYEGFARLAFGDSRGSVMGRGKLLKYRTRGDIAAQKSKEEGLAVGKEGGSKVADAKMEDLQLHERQHKQQQPSPKGGKRINSGTVRQQRDLKRGGIANEREMGQRLGEKDGKVECTICWTVKRDVFDIPMLIVMNVGLLLSSILQIDNYKLRC
jgi:hypothetical protein